MTEFFEEMMFEVNLKEFATRVGYICSLENNGKLNQEGAYQEIKKLYKSLKRSHQDLNIEAQNKRQESKDEADPNS